MCDSWVVGQPKWAKKFLEWARNESIQFENKADKEEAIRQARVARDEERQRVASESNRRASALEIENEELEKQKAEVQSHLQGELQTECARCEIRASLP